MNCYRPSVDVFFDSLARNWPKPGVAVLLTGWGAMGPKGCSTSVRKGWWTIAQDVPRAWSATCQGPPSKLVRPEEILPLARIAEAIRKVPGSGTGVGFPGSRGFSSTRCSTPFSVASARICP